MDFLFQAMGIDDFEPILEAYGNTGSVLGDALDGGAGNGTTARKMLSHLNRTATIYAYEPFPGNHRFFEGHDPRICLQKTALGNARSEMTLAVSAVVTEDSDWGKRGLSGYSSAGHLRGGPPSGEHDAVVKVVRADEDIPAPQKVDFVKLDLQGGELNALKGMSGFLKTISLAWLECYFLSDNNPIAIYDHMLDNDFLVFDTEYMFKGDVTDEALKSFRVSKRGKKLSSGSTVWYGFKRRPWKDFRSEVQHYVRTLGLIQTDICCVNQLRLDQFLNALPHIRRENHGTPSI